MKLRVEITMDNAAFDDPAGREAARILKELAADFEDCDLFPGCGPNGNSWLLEDINGNTVGKAQVTR
jgi:hypothetical protein